jgi:hypothetical protein
MTHNRMQTVEIKDDEVSWRYYIHSTQNYWVFGLFPSSGVLGGRNTTFWKLDLFPSSGDGGEDTYSVGPLRKT